MKLVINDGGRAAAGFTGRAGDCVTRAISIVTGLPYAKVYADLSEGCISQRVGKRGKKKTGAGNGVNVNRKWFKEYMGKLGFRFVATMGIGTGCHTHLRDGELPTGRLIVSVSKHYTAVIDGVIHDTFDPSRDGNRCVYGYWIK